MENVNIDLLISIMDTKTDESRELRKKLMMSDMIQNIVDSDFTTAETLGILYGVCSATVNNMPSDLKPLEVDTLRKAFQTLSVQLKPCKQSLQ